MTSQEIKISGQDYWFKVVDMLQQNWALIESHNTGCVVYFIGDTSGVFDKIEFFSFAEAERQLRVNGFGRYAEDPESQKFIAPPLPPFHQSSHPNGLIYSSGRFWKSE